MLAWITRKGPFMDDDRLHSGDELFLFAGDLVTDSALAKATSLVAAGNEAFTFSFTPSRCTANPLQVIWTDSANQSRTIDVPNFWDHSVLSTWLGQQADKQIASWSDLHGWASRR